MKDLKDGGRAMQALVCHIQADKASSPTSPDWLRCKVIWISWYRSPSRIIVQATHDPAPATAINTSLPIGTPFLRRASQRIESRHLDTTDSPSTHTC